jgi:hypothetical protein
VFDHRSGRLAIEGVPLAPYGLAAKSPKLAKLQDEVFGLEKRRIAAEAAVTAARDFIPQARDRDAEAAARALRSGKDMPAPRHEGEARAALEDAERTLAALTKATADAAQELEAAKATHRASLLADFAAARRENAEAMARLAPELSSRYGRDFALADIVAKMTPPPEAVEFWGPARNTTTVIGVQTMETVAGVPRGTVEQVLGHLGGLVREFEEPVPVGGSEALDVLDAVQDRGGGTGYEPL